MDKDEALKIIEMHLDSSGGAALREACAIFIPELAECDGEKKPAEWNNEDYVMQRAALEIIMASPKTVASTILKESVIVWIQSLKGRVQPKQEWSEEDERRLNSLKCAIMYYQEQHPFTTDAKGDMEWLNNFKERLCPQHHWIPTEEQMKALDMGIREVWTQQDSAALMSLYKDLKKLRDDNSRA